MPPPLAYSSKQEDTEGGKGSKQHNRREQRPMHKDKEVKTVGLGFADALALLFIALKLTGHINWSWIWVLSPIWITISFLGLLFLVIVVISIITDRR